MDTTFPEKDDRDYPEVIFPTTEEIERKIRGEKLEKRLADAGIIGIGGHFDDYISRLEEMAKNGCRQAESGLTDLDKKIAGGFMPGQLIIVAGRPSMGKSAFAQGIAENIAHTGKAVLFFSLEMGAYEIMDRYLCKNAGIAMDKLKIKGGLQQADYAKIAEILPEMMNTPLFISDKSGINAREVINSIAVFKEYMSTKNLELGLVVIDYLQLMSAKNPKINREAEISEMTRSLKIAARELEVPIMALSQLNRGLENRTEKRPQMADLRESGAIEQDADIIVGLYREEVYYKDKEEIKGIAEACILKNRNGELANIKMLFDGAKFEFKNYAPNDGY